MKRVAFLALCTATLSSSVAAYQELDIRRADVERIIRTLASDEMEGRRAFTPAADRAAEFISNEFSALGLDPLPGLDGYLQPFAMQQFAVGEIDVTVNGQRIPRDGLGASVSQETLEWNPRTDVRIVRINRNDDPQQKAFSALRGSGNTLVLIHPQHTGFFNNARGFLNRESPVFEVGQGPNAVFVLTPHVDADQFQVHATAHREVKNLANVAGMIPGRRADEIVLFSAHYDHLGYQPRRAVGGDSIANGANDDASGTTAVITLAKYFKGQGQSERTLLFVTFTAEEMGGFGSSYFSRQLDPDQIVAMFNIEMIGKPATEEPNTAWITGFERSSFGRILQHAVEGTAYVFYADPYPRQNLFYRSDNATLARLGVPAHSISTTPIDVDRDYHGVTDEVGTLDLDHMTNTIVAIAKGAATIVSGQETPTRVDRSQVR